MPAKNTQLHYSPTSQPEPHLSTSLPPPHSTSPRKPKSLAGIQIGLIIISIVIGTFSLLQTMIAEQLIDIKKARAEEVTRPANLEIVAVTDKNCADCASLTGYLNWIKERNVNITKETSLDKQEAQATELIQKYNIKKIPFFVAVGELQKDEELNQMWSRWGVVEGNTFTLTATPPPYLNIETNKVEGRVSVTYLTDTKSCGECYDVLRHKEILEKNYGVKIVNEKTVEMTSLEGKTLAKKYNITAIPTFLADNEIAVYNNLLSAWQSVGSIESDGTYIFRKPEQMGTYYDLAKKQIVKPAVQTNTNTNQQAQ